MFLVKDWIDHWLILSEFQILAYQKSRYFRYDEIWVGSPHCWMVETGRHVISGKGSLHPEGHQGRHPHGHQDFFKARGAAGSGADATELPELLEQWKKSMAFGEAQVTIAETPGECGDLWDVMEISETKWRCRFHQISGLSDNKRYWGRL